MIPPALTVWITIPRQVSRLQRNLTTGSRISMPHESARAATLSLRLAGKAASTLNAGATMVYEAETEV